MKHRQLEYEEVMLRKPNPNPIPEIILLLDNIQIIENIAGIFRVADAMSVLKIYIHGEAHIYNTKSFRAITRLNKKNTTFQLLNFENSISLIKEYKQNNFQIVGLDFTNLSIPLANFKTTKNLLLIIGSERNGISEDFLDLCNICVHIPMLGSISSLNVNQATSIALYAIRNNYPK